ncbi:transcriptional regulator [Oceanidesulfovibrio indonesiensis]|uniref:Transcriptional regulator n=1 Tax=Oceanidesulfovibrio indonesiensis TaxID=54767 RepID=A0A7M3MAH2_9BACT|nr:metalloregulator ArsR/SmtB family transcription factor [Oceanidesulfovibrio indonesiensis]TVM13874.1 transcriptional regulator [Oceanidesulfovibrio indonesiensis]
MIDSEKQARIFKVLSVGTRVRMLEMLKHRSFCVNALAKMLDISPSAVSQHLRVLRDADLVIADKEGYFVHYRVNEQTMAEWRTIADNLFKIPKGL